VEETWIQKLKRNVKDYFSETKIGGNVSFARPENEHPTGPADIPQDVLNEYKRLGGGTTQAGRKYRRVYMGAKFGE
jgi:hypothetical protein